MKILLMSDNHGRWPKVHELVEYYRPQVDLILHCGDSEFAPDDPVWEKVDAVVTGNNDYDPEYPDELIINTRQGRIFLTHGHFHNVILTFEPQTVKVEFYDDDKHRLDQLTQVFDRNLLEEAGYDTSQN